MLLQHIRRYDWLLMGAVLLLMVLGLITLFSLSSASPYPFFNRQITWVGIGLAFLILASFVDFHLFRTQTSVVFLFYIAVIALLALVFVSSDLRGMWLKFGSVFFQPVEAAKIVMIILLAKFFSKRHIEIYRIRHLLVSGIYLAIPALLVLVQPDLGSAIVLVSIWLVIIVFSGIKLRHFFFLLVCAAIVSVFAWNFTLAPYQKARITSFINPQADPKGAGYQVNQSMIAIGSGKIWGKGLGYGSQSHLNFLPEAQTDFIFAAFAEEWGFIGSVVMLALFLLLIWRIVRIGQTASDNFSRLYALGFAGYIFIQSFIHIGMNLGTLPITGITLPFVSYGGSSLVTLLIGVGVLQNIKINARPVREAEEWRSM